MAVGENNYCSLGLGEPLRGWGPGGLGLDMCGGVKRDEKKLNLTNSIPKSFRIIYIFTESFRYV